MAENRYIPGEHWVIDDITGFRIRSSDAVKQWNGLVVHKDYAEPRHPQDSVRARPESISVTDPRPQPPARFVGPTVVTTSEARSPGDDYLVVTSINSFREGDRLMFPLSNGDTWYATVTEIQEYGYLLQEDGARILLETGSGSLLHTDLDNSSNTLRLDASLPYGVLSGTPIFNNTAMAEPTLP